MDVDQRSRFEESRRCPVCDVQSEYGPRYDGEHGIYAIDCTNCGSYRISESSVAELLDFYSDKRSAHLPLVAHKIRRRQRGEADLWVSPTWLQDICEGPLEFPSAFEQVENLIIFMAEILGPGVTMPLNHQTCQAAVGAKDGQSLGWVLLQAYEQDWVQGNPSKGLNVDYSIPNGTLSLKGWEWYNEIGRHKQSHIAFMAMKFGDGELNAMIEDHFRPAIEETGFELRLLSDEPEAGLIDNRLRVEIRRSRLLIADLSHHNNGAYWEAGFAEGLGIPVIYTCKKSVLEDENQKIHFDTRNQLIVPWDTATQSDAVKELKATIRNSLPDEAILDDPERAS